MGKSTEPKPGLSYAQVNKVWSCQSDHHTTSFWVDWDRLQLISQSQPKNSNSNHKQFIHARSNHLLALISDICILFCRPAFNKLSTRQDIWYACFEYNHQKNWWKSTEPKPGLFQQKRMQMSLINASKLLLYACMYKPIIVSKFFGCDWLMGPFKDKTGLSLPEACGLMIKLVWSNILKIFRIYMFYKLKFIFLNQIIFI